MYNFIIKIHTRFVLKRAIKRLNRDLYAYSWYIGVEKSTDPELLVLYVDAESLMRRYEAELLKF